MSIAAIVLAAGKGTRMKSALPKVLHEAAGKPLLLWPVEAARSVGGNPLVVVIGHGAEQVERLLQDRFAGAAGKAGGEVGTAMQADQKGTGHAVMQAMPALEGFAGTVLILYGDTPLLTAASLQRLLDDKARAAAPLALWTTTLSDPTGYGRIVRAADGSVDRIVEHKDASPAERTIREVNPGCYAVDASFLRASLPQLSNHNAQGEYYLTDLIALARAGGHVVVGVEVDPEETLGVNDRVQLAEVSAVLRRRVQRRAQLAGVTIVDPASTHIDDDVSFGRDVVVEPGVMLRGRTRIGDGVRIGVGCVIQDTVIEAAALVHPYTLCDGATVGSGAIVGPFARLRPDTVLLEGAHVGNFVELKKTRLGRGSKANHLAYLGDSEIGSGVNIGAGTITCNYDGAGKYRTQLGDNVFVGSNSTLVAPIEVQAGAYIAAGSVVTEPVPQDAVAFGRARQSNKEGHAPIVRERNAARAKKKPKV